MKFYNIEIVSFVKFRKVHYYSLHIEGEEHNETDRFFERFIESEYHEDLEKIKYWLEVIGNSKGAEPRFFRHEDNAAALPPPIEFNNLRLYCLRCTNDVVILGNGGLKTSQRVQDSQEVYPIFRFMNKFNQIFTEKVQAREITYGDKYLRGNLTLEFEV